MRVICPHCKQRFDVKHMVVLAEYRRLREAAGKPVDPGAAGNVLDSADAAAKAGRAEAIRRRGRQNRPSRSQACACQGRGLRPGNRAPSKRKPPDGHS